MAVSVPQTSEDLRDCSFYWNNSFLFKGKASLTDPEESIKTIFGERLLRHYRDGVLRIEFNL
jgi:hypothetical protein